MQLLLTFLHAENQSAEEIPDFIKAVKKVAKVALFETFCFFTSKTIAKRDFRVENSFRKVFQLDSLMNLKISLPSLITGANFGRRGLLLKKLQMMLFLAMFPKR